MSSPPRDLIFDSEKGNLMIVECCKEVFEKKNAVFYSMRTDRDEKGVLAAIIACFSHSKHAGLAYGNTKLDKNAFKVIAGIEGVPAVTALFGSNADGSGTAYSATLLAEEMQPKLSAVLSCPIHKAMYHITLLFSPDGEMPPISTVLPEPVPKPIGKKRAAQGTKAVRGEPISKKGRVEDDDGEEMDEDEGDDDNEDEDRMDEY
ncbi:hypothetical protein BJ878DRAFT_20801 [Calycina marina]|uniref:Uncharacterized protein n=1 Tax=Calycina marina TaxID=1763456 RepID=A0A9P7YU63_9HELO|nr:hypothetical protein BJ878DRAFT_20801 [Calycina marina]